MRDIREIYREAFADALAENLQGQQLDELTPELAEQARDYAREYAEGEVAAAEALEVQGCPVVRRRAVRMVLGNRSGRGDDHCVVTPYVRATVLGLFTAVALLLGSAPAWAHAELESSDPADNASLATAPSAVSLTFSEEIAPNLATVTVSGPGGTRYEAGPATGNGPTLRVPLRPLGPAGAYQITYRVTSDDGHPIVGDVLFTLTKPGPAAAAAPSAPSAAQPAPTAAATGDDGGAPVWPWIVGAVVVVAGGAAFALRRGRA